MVDPRSCADQAQTLLEPIRRAIHYRAKRLGHYSFAHWAVAKQYKLVSYLRGVMLLNRRGTLRAITLQLLVRYRRKKEQTGLRKQPLMASKGKIVSPLQSLGR